MNDADKAKRDELLVRFNDLYNRESRLMSAVRFDRTKADELAQVMDEVESLREQIAALSNETGGDEDA